MDHLRISTLNVKSKLPLFLLLISNRGVSSGIHHLGSVFLIQVAEEASAASKKYR